MADRTGTKKRSGWKTALAVWAVFLLALGAAACLLLYKYLGIYEITRPELVIENLISDPDRLIQLADSSLDSDFSSFEDPHALFSDYCEKFIDGRKLTYFEEKSKRSDSEVCYSVRAGANRLCGVTVVADETSDPGFGRKIWKLGSVSAAETLKALDSVTLKIKAFSGTDVTVNGVPLTEEYITGTDTSVTGMTALEASMTDTPEMVVYTVSPLYGSINVSYTSDKGSERTVTPVSTGASELTATIIPDTKTITVSAPESVSVFVGGVQLSTADGSAVKDDFFEGLDRFTEDGAAVPLTVDYSIDGLYAEHEIRAVGSGQTALEPLVSSGGKRIFFDSGESVPEDVVSAAKAFFESYMEYSAKGSGVVFNDVRNRVLYGTELFYYILNSYEAMQWASKTDIEYKELRYENFSRVTDLCWTCTVYYNAEMTAVSWEEERSYDMEKTCELALVHSSYGWQVGAMREIVLD